MSASVTFCKRSAVGWLLLSLFGCANTAVRGGEEQAASPLGTSVVVYSGRGAILVDPLFEIFTQESGIEVEVRYDKSTETLANRFATEGAHTEADVFFAQDSGYLGALAAKELLTVLPASISAQIDEAYRAADNRWVATSGRARVLVYNPQRISEEELPKSLSELKDPRYEGRFGWAPQNASFQAHVSALRSLWGEQVTSEWLTDMQALKPTVYPKNSAQVQAVSNGEIDIGWVNHYYLHKLRAADPNLSAENYSFSEAGDPGNLMMLSGVGVSAHSDNPIAAVALVNFLVSEEAQLYFAERVYEYPTRTGVAHHPDVPPIGDRLAAVDQAALTDLGPTLKMLRDLGLQ
jgi:iron(III) transport system substrate-binding protein